MRLPYAARTLRQQILDAKPKATVENRGEPDGFGVIRSIAVNPATANWLEPILEVISDSRIVSMSRDSRNWLVLTFSPRIDADVADPFPIEQVERVMRGE
jgi:hypothetical protein